MRHAAILKSQSGFALVGAIFVLVVLAFLGTVMVVMSGVQSSTPVFALQGARAYHAARSGLEWGINQALSVPATCSAPPGTTTPFNLDAFSIQVTCQFTTHQEGPTSYNVYRIVSLAQTGTFGSSGYVSRRVEARITDAP